MRALYTGVALLSSQRVQGFDPDQVLDLLLTVGYVDGQLHVDEKEFIRRYIDRLVECFADGGSAAAWRDRFATAYSRLDTELAALAAEVVANGDQRYITTRLKVRAVALFRAFTPADQVAALDLLGAMTSSDGVVSQPERELMDELLAYFNAPATLPDAQTPLPGLVDIAPVAELPLLATSHPWLDPLEQRYAADPGTLANQVASDYDLIFRAISVWERQRARGNGRLVGVNDIGQLAPGSRFLDHHVHVMRPDRPTELIVLGDLHGCYGSLKAALLQSDFIARALRHQQDPLNQPDVKLVLLGDYIDRGRFGFEGIVRAALQLLVALPDHVILLRGNHEFLVRREDQIASAVHPAEAIRDAAAVVPHHVLEGYRHLFDHMPTSLLFERTLFAHGGIPRDDTMERFRDLSGLEDSVVRFEMMWSDPVATDRVPLELQRESPRFTFGREQFGAFMRRIGCHTMFRGHEQIDAGFATIFDLGHTRLHTVFSAGGHDNTDLPPESRYRTVTPMALTLRSDGVATPWPIQYQPFNDPSRNGFHR